MYECGTLRGWALASYSTWWSQSDTGGKFRRCSWRRSPGSWCPAAGDDGVLRGTVSVMGLPPWWDRSGQRYVLAGADEHGLVGQQRHLRGEPGGGDQRQVTAVPPRY